MDNYEYQMFYDYFRTAPRARAGSYVGNVVRKQYDTFSRDPGQFFYTKQKQAKGLMAAFGTFKAMKERFTKAEVVEGGNNTRVAMRNESLAT